MKYIAAIALLAGLAGTCAAENITGVCMVSTNNSSRGGSTSSVMFRSHDCDREGGKCTSSDHSSIPWSRWTGVSPEALQQEGAQLNARMAGDAGEIHCNGTVHEGVLAGKYEFVPSEAFVQKMSSMGFDGINVRNQQGFLMLDVSLAWVKQMKDAGVTELTTGKLMGLRALHVDPEYIHAMAAAGYPELRAGKLTEMRAVGVTPEKVQEAKSMGFTPTEQELVQMAIFKVDRPFVERMRARGLKDLTLAKLIQIKIFKLDN